MSELQTVDIPGVEIMATGGPVFAIGSKPGGDFYTRQDLEAIATAHVELGNEIKAPLKVGHSDAQQLLKNSGVTAGELPAVGWLDSATFRVEDGDNGESKLVADLKAVPKKLAALMQAGAYRTRSSEIKRYASQTTQKTYDWVVYGLALLGNNTPAIQTLDDVYKLYEAAGIEDPGATVVVVKHAAPSTPVWDSEDSLEDLRGELNEALNPFGYDMPGVRNCWVRDIARSSNVAIVSEGYGNDDEAWVVPFTIDAANDVVVPASRDEWIAAERPWVAAAKAYETNFRRRAESRSMELTLTDEQATTLREQLAIEGDAPLTPEAITAAAEARANELADAKTKADAAEAKLNESGGTEERIVKLEADLEAEQTKRFEMERTSDIEKAQRQGRLDPADTEKWEKRYESLGAEVARELLFDLPVNEDFVREFGSSEHGGDDLETPEAKQYEAEIARNTNTPVAELI